MKKELLFIVLILANINLVFSQNMNKKLNDVEISKILNQEIKAIHNAEDFVIFLTKHAANYEDFDSLYTIMENKPCPKNLSYDLVHGDGGKTLEVGNRFLYLIGRNFWPKFDVNKDTIKTYNYKPVSFYDQFSDLYKIIKPDIENKIKFEINSFNIETVTFSNHSFGYSTVKNNFKSILEELNSDGRKKSKSFIMKFNKEVEADVDFKLNKALKIYKYNFNGPYEKSFWKQINNQDEDFLKNDLGGSIIAENISRYISAQVFGDIGFVYVNNKIIFIDLDK